MAAMNPGTLDVQAIADELSRLAGQLSLLLIVVGGFLLALPWVRKRVGGNLLFYGCLLLVVSALGSGFIVDAYNTLSGWPLWGLILLGGVFLLSALQLFLALILGWDTASRIIANLATGLFSSIFAIVSAPFATLRRLLGGQGE